VGLVMAEGPPVVIKWGRCTTELNYLRSGSASARDAARVAAPILVHTTGVTSSAPAPGATTGP
jgi:hypothetical protein